MDYQTIIAGLIPSALAVWLMHTHRIKSKDIENLKDEVHHWKGMFRQKESQLTFKDRNFKTLESKYKENRIHLAAMEKHTEKQDEEILALNKRISFLKTQNLFMAYTPPQAPIITRMDLEQHGIRIYLDEFELRTYSSKKLDKLVQQRAAELIAKHIKPEYETVNEEGGRTRTTINYLFKQI